MPGPPRDTVDYEGEQTRILGVLKRIGKGGLALAYQGQDGSCLCRYSTPDGWKFVAFDDAAEWNCFDSITTPEGRTFGFDEISDHLPRVHLYEPPDPRIRHF